MIWHERPILAFDTETTGPDPDEAMIVSYALVHIAPDPTEALPPITGLVNPGIPIPEAATAVHGVTDEMVAEQGVPTHTALQRIAQELSKAKSRGSMVCIFNAAYDMSVLLNQAYRVADHSLMALLPQLYIVDPLVIDKQLDKYRRGSRQLAAMSQHYGVHGVAWHTSEADALAAGKLAYTMAGAFPQIRRMKQVELHEAQARWRAEQSASLQHYFRTKKNPPDPEAIVDGGWPFQGAAAARKPEIPT